MKPVVIKTLVGAAFYGMFYFMLVHRDPGRSLPEAAVTTADLPVQNALRMPEQYTPEVMPTPVGMSATEMRRAMESPVQRFSIEAEKETTLYARQGTALRFPAGIFVDEKGNVPKGNVRIELKECYDLPAILADKLTTTSGNDMIETAGMVQITARSGQQELRIREGGSYEILFPRNDKEGMQLFYGATSGSGSLDWIPAVDGTVQETAKPLRPSPVFVADTVPLISGTDDCFIEIVSSDLRMGNQRHKNDHYRWKIGTGTQTLNEYFVGNFNPTMDMLEHFCILHHESEFTLILNPDGTIREHFISHSSAPEFDSLIYRFLAAMPPIQVSTMTKRFSESNACILRFGSKDRVSNKAIEQQDAYVADFRKKNKSGWDKELTTVSAEDLNYFVFRSTELGWINCDRFIDVEGERTDVLVKTEWADSCNVFMVFDNWCSILQGQQKDGAFVFDDVPVGQKVKIYSLKCVNNQPELCMTDYSTTSRPVKLSGYRKFSLGELETKLYLN